MSPSNPPVLEIPVLGLQVPTAMPSVLGGFWGSDVDLFACHTSILPTDLSP